ncbi:MAG: hypothetical protein M1816_006694 [Peltula sp. TS41687]|nr:MAG: hypothetical protein M1816_006694 [Peltula sp. TS41687]
MSNQAVGQIYQRIIADVIENSLVDFEESAVDRRTLDELREVWQKKLSSLQVAQFPWDPQPAPTPTTATPTVPSNGHVGRAQSQQSPKQQSSTPTSNGKNNADGVKIKTEPGSEATLSVVDIPPLLPTNHPAVKPTLSNTPAAAQRAAALMVQKFGSQANTSVGTLQQGLKANAQAATGQNQANQQQQPQQRNSPNPSQTDGADEWAPLSRRGRDDERRRVEADHMIRRQVEERGLEMEGGGLLRPLSEHRDQGKAIANSAKVSPLPFRMVPSSGARTAGYDGADDMDDGRRRVKSEDNQDDVNDEDAINSDLDDPDDDLDDNPDDDDSNAQIMLCMYDKVQRTKNKWKCILKDGVLTVGGKEFVSRIRLPTSILT